MKQDGGFDDLSQKKIWQSKCMIDKVAVVLRCAPFASATSPMTTSDDETDVKLNIIFILLFFCTSPDVYRF